MGFHFFDLAVILVIALIIFGPKALQSMARGAGKTMNQAKEAKDKLVSELHMEDLAELTQHIPRIPLNTQQAVQMLLTAEPEHKNPEQEQKDKDKDKEKGREEVHQQEVKEE